MTRPLEDIQQDQIRSLMKIVHRQIGAQRSSFHEAFFVPFFIGAAVWFIFTLSCLAAGSAGLIEYHVSWGKLGAGLIALYVVVMWRINSSGGKEDADALEREIEILGELDKEAARYGAVQFDQVRRDREEYLGHRSRREQFHRTGQ